MGNPNEAGVTIESLDASLDELLKAADAKDVADKLSKAYGGVNIENSGTMSDGKPSGGGQAGAGDIGGIDDMMIGKMIGGLASMGYSDSQIRAFMRGKMDDEGEEEETEETDEGDEPMEEDIEKSLRKSMGRGFADAFGSDPAISEGIDAAPFMEALTVKTVQSLDLINKSVHRGQLTQTKVNKSMAVVLVQQNQLIKAMAQRLGVIERQPMPQRGITDVPTARALAKGMPGEVGARAPQQLRKSEALNVLTYMNLVKGIKHIDGNTTLDTIARYEAGGQISENAVSAVHQFLATHPGEAEAAKRYA